MPKGELFIKKNNKMSPANTARFDYDSARKKFVQSDTGDWVDTFLQYGVSFSQSGLSSLMAPAANKAIVENKSRLEHGKRLVRNRDLVRKEDREVSIEMHITAASVGQFWERYDNFCEQVLDVGFMELVNGHRPTKVFRLTYESCSQFQEFLQQMAKFTLRLNEPDPTNRGFENSQE